MRPTRERVEDFLRLNAGQRYTPTEIGVGIGVPRDEASARVNWTLKKLAQEGKVKRANLTGTKEAVGRRGNYVVYWWIGN